MERPWCIETDNPLGTLGIMLDILHSDAPVKIPGGVKEWRTMR
jgi:hypothetical protein